MSDLNSKTVAQLKELLQARQLPTNGNKSDLVQRFQKFLDENPDDDFLKNDNEADNKTNDEGNENATNRVGVQQQNRKSMFSFKDIKESLEKFDGEKDKDINEWIENFEEQATIFGWNELERLLYGRRLLTSAAKMYVNSELKPKTWIQLKEGLCKEFKIEVNSALIHEKLSEMKKKKDESFREFCYRVIDMAAPAKMETAAVIRYVVNGIQDSTANKCFCIHLKPLVN